MSWLLRAELLLSPDTKTFSSSSGSPSNTHICFFFNKGHIRQPHAHYRHDRPIIHAAGGALYQWSASLWRQVHEERSKHPARSLRDLACI
jgi:hypothetical protein